MTAEIIQVPTRFCDGVELPFQHIGREWAARFVLGRRGTFGMNQKDDAHFHAIAEWCRERWGDPLQPYDCGDIPVRRWAVENFLGMACSLYLGTAEQGVEFKMRWC